LLKAGISTEHIARKASTSRVALIGLWALMAVSGVTGRDLFGRTVYYYIGGYSVIVWTMVLLFAASVVLSHRGLAIARSWHV